MDILKISPLFKVMIVEQISQSGLAECGHHNEGRRVQKHLEERELPSEIVPIMM